MGSRLQDVILRGINSARPLATDVAPGTLYYSTDLGTTNRSNGTIWETYTDTGGSGGVSVHATTHNSGGSDPVTVTALAGYPGGSTNFLRADATFATPSDSGITQLTGNITAGPGSGSQVATIADDAVTYAKIQDVSTASKLLGRGGPTSDLQVMLLIGAETSIIDESQYARTLTAIGGAARTTAQFKYGIASITFDGAGDWIQTADSTDFLFGSGDFTVEVWVRFLVKTSEQAIMGQWGFGGSDNSWFLYISSGALVFIPTSVVTLSFPFVPILGQWYHLAVDRSGTTARMYIDGVVVDTETSFIGSLSDSTQPLSIGAIGVSSGFSSFDFNGQMDEIRISKGIARYAGAFTPPTAAFPRASAGSAGNVEEISLGSGLSMSGTTLNGPSARIAAIGIIIDGGASVITTGVKGYIEIPFACTIQAVTLLADVSGSIVIDIWKDTYANYPPVVADTITAAAKPTISSAIKSQDTTLTGWTTSIAAGDILGFNVDSIATIKRVTLSLRVQVP